MSDSLYRDQLSLTERHLDSLIHDADEAISLLTTLSTSFKSVETQTSSFQARCDHLLTEQTRLQKLADEVGTNLYYYAYLDNVSRRLNAPGASRLAEHSDLAEALHNLEACIEFMSKNVCAPTYSWPLIHVLTLHSPDTGMPSHTSPGISPCSPRRCTSSRSASPGSWRASRRTSPSASARHSQSPLSMLSHTADSRR